MTRQFDLLYEALMVNTLSTSDLYKFYFLATLNSQGQLNSPLAKFLTDEFIDYIKPKYLIVFLELIENQLRKYAARKRHDPSFSLDEMDKFRGNAAKYDELMKQTYRSDMKRRNDVWNLITEYTKELAQSSDKKSIFFYIDRLNNCIHNTQENILVKLPNGHKLLEAFDNIHGFQSIQKFTQYIPKDFRELLNH